MVYTLVETNLTDRFEMVTRTPMRGKIYQKSKVSTFHFMTDNDVKRVDWFKYFISFVAMKDKKITY